VPQYWLKPVGVTRDPFEPVPRDFLAKLDRDHYRMITGPPKFSSPPKMEKGDRVLLHAVHYARLIADAEILDHEVWERHPKWGERWPWVYPVRVDVWVDDVETGPKSRGIAPDRAINRIQAGGEYAKLSRAEYEAARHALLDVPAAHVR
jgi:hypothetical protein